MTLPRKSVEGRNGVHLSVSRLPDGRWGYRWLGCQWHREGGFGSIEAAFAAGRLDIEERGLVVIW